MKTRQICVVVGNLGKQWNLYVEGVQIPTPIKFGFEERNNWTEVDGVDTVLTSQEFKTTLTIPCETFQHVKDRLFLIDGVEFVGFAKYSPSECLATVTQYGEYVAINKVKDLYHFSYVAVDPDLFRRTNFVRDISHATIPIEGAFNEFYYPLPSC